MAYRTQQYVATNRAFGPYLPPYPLQGVGRYGARGAGDWTDPSSWIPSITPFTPPSGEEGASAGANLAASKASQDALQEVLRPSSADPPLSDNLQELQHKPKNWEPLPADPKCPAGLWFDLNSEKCVDPYACPSGSTLVDGVCVKKDAPIPFNPKPYVDPTPAPTPAPKAAAPNYLLWAGIVAAVGVVGYLAFTKMGGTRGGYHVASNPRRRGRRH